MTVITEDMLRIKRLKRTRRWHGFCVSCRQFSDATAKSYLREHRINSASLQQTHCFLRFIQ